MEDIILKKFAESVKKLRTEKGLSQEDLALKANLDRTYIGRIERAERNPSLIVLYKLAIAFDMDLSELLKTIK